MKIDSFRTGMVIIVIIVVIISSSSAFYLYDNYLTKQTYKEIKKNTENLIALVNEIQKTLNSSHTSQSFDTLINEINKNEYVSNVLFVDTSGNIKYYYVTNIVVKDSLFKRGTYFSSGKKLINVFDINKSSYEGISVNAGNTPYCFSCHKNTGNNLGYIVFDFAAGKINKDINITRKYSILVSIFILVVSGAFILLMHYRYVKASLGTFMKSIKNINRGNLDERVPVLKSKELGSLAECFNKMLDNFQETQKQLDIYHEKELHNARKMATVGEMSARLAHEIRNPVMGIAGAVEIIAESTESETDKQILQELKRQAGRVNEAVSKLLRYAKSEKLNLKKNNINELIKSIVFFLKNRPGTNKITFVLELNPKIPEFYFDKEQTENAFMNISLNAIQAIEDAGIITYRTKYDKKNKTVEITVEDTGKGIPEDKINEIFKPFYTTKTEGTGLGTAIAKEIIENHNGTIYAESELGKGTRIIVILPAAR
ncbi:MAG: HAMP domain-containing protein [Chlorobi bacterium]|nr:HAMP domain-containing protein [Chlorobiota bacterium]